MPLRSNYLIDAATAHHRQPIPSIPPALSDRRNPGVHDDTTRTATSPQRLPVNLAMGNERVAGKRMPPARLGRPFGDRDPLALLALLQVGAIVVCGALTVARFEVFAHIDERAHFAYVQEIAEHGRLPFLGRTVISAQVQAMSDHTYPRPSERNSASLGLAGQSYEAFQPPLYYLLAAPAFAAPNDYRAKLYVIRALDFVLLLGAVALTYVLARAVFRERWRLPLCLSLSVLLWPGVIVRAITVSNTALELPLALAFLLVAYEARQRRSARWMAAAGALLGACLLTKLTLAFLAPVLLIPLVAVLRERGWRAGAPPAAVALAVPIVMLLPWLVSNHDRYSSLTADRQARDLQQSFINPSNHQYGIGDLVTGLRRLVDGVLPQEWWVHFQHHPVLTVPLRLMPLALLAAALVPLVRRPSLLRTAMAALLGLPLILAVLELAVTLPAANWDVLLPRYLYAPFVALTLFVVWAWRRSARDDRPVAALASGSTAIALVAWAGLAAAHLR